jgi:hypothetical protein
LDNFSQNQAKKVFQELAKLSSFYIDEALIERLVLDLAKDLGKIRPIELQVVGSQLQAEKKKITQLSDYKSTKDLIEQFLESIIQDCGPENEPIARSILYLLTDEKLTRPIKSQNDLELLLVTNFLFNKSESLKNEQVDLVLDILVGSGLVSLLPGLPKRYQLIHDYFVTFIRESIQERNKKQLDNKISNIERLNKIFLSENSKAKIKIKILIVIGILLLFFMMVLTIEPIKLALFMIRSQESSLGVWTVGDIGFEVVRLQTMLKKAGYDNIEITGLYDEKTRKAVFAFQERTEILYDGIVGSQTFGKLQKYHSYGVIVPIQSDDTKEDILKTVQKHKSEAYILELKALNSSYVHVKNIPNLSDAKKLAKELQEKLPKSDKIKAFVVLF